MRVQRVFCVSSYKAICQKWLPCTFLSTSTLCYKNIAVLSVFVSLMKEITRERHRSSQHSDNHKCALKTRTVEKRRDVRSQRLFDAHRERLYFWIVHPRHSK